MLRKGNTHETVLHHLNDNTSFASFAAQRLQICHTCPLVGRNGSALCFCEKLAHFSHQSLFFIFGNCHKIKSFLWSCNTCTRPKGVQYYWFVVVSDRVVNVRHMPQKNRLCTIAKTSLEFRTKTLAQEGHCVSEIPSVAYLSAALSYITARYGLWQCLEKIIADDGRWMQGVEVALGERALLQD